MDIVIVSQYLRDIENFVGNNSRFVYLAKMLSQDPDNSVEIITSDFYHATKKHFKQVGELPGIKVTALHENGYRKNVCLKRFGSHKKLANNVAKYLKNRKKPDVCYCAVPSLDVAYKVSKYCVKNNVRFIVDIQDLWPEAFKMVLRIPVISDIIFAPMQRKANRIYASADKIIAVSKTYAKRALKANKKDVTPTVVYLGTEKATFECYAISTEVEKDKFVVGCVGSMSDSYDLYTVIDAISKLNCASVKLLAMGDGALRQSFIDYANDKGINAEFTGGLTYPKMIEGLMQCDVAVNPIRKGATGSIIYKVGDYARAELPVVNTQESEEYRSLLDEYEAGINCECENAEQVSQALKKLIDDGKLRTKMAENSRKLGLERFDEKNAYHKLVDEILTTSVGTMRIAYCGTLGHSYDITCVIEAIRRLKEEYRSKIQFVVMGDGPKKAEFLEKAKGLPIVFTGRLEYPEMVWLLSRCDVAVNPIVKGAAQSIINKHMDYAMAGLPVINTQECVEYRDMIEQYQSGINCECDNVSDVEQAIIDLAEDELLRKRMGQNSREMGAQCFDRAQTYSAICQAIMSGKTDKK